MILIVGLGNPGKKFEHTRHNAGFMALEFFAKKNNFPEFESVKKYDALVSQKDTALLAMPQTFMNESGKSVKELLSNTSNPTLIVIHDDIDLPIGTFKIVKERGSAGHKGVESIIQNVGNENVVRFRMGIQPAGGKPTDSEHFVIKKFTDQELGAVYLASEKVAEALDCFINNGLEKTMNEYNR
jgi:peptidyl-tRNA hydrolase, PTH1 family